MFQLADFLKTLITIGPAVIKDYSEVKNTLTAAIGMLHSDDQATAISALSDIMADNDAGHARLQEKLKAAQNA